MFAAHCSHLSSVYVVSNTVIYYTPYNEQIKAAVINFLYSFPRIIFFTMTLYLVYTSTKQTSAEILRESIWLKQKIEK